MKRHVLIQAICRLLAILFCGQILAAALPAGAETDTSVVLKLDGGYTQVLDAAKEKQKVVYLPAGRPRIPRVIANCQEHLVGFEKPFFADGDTVAYATYEYDCLPERIGFVFVKTAELGFELQYDDRYTFTPRTLSGKVTFASEDTSVASVTDSGVITARKISDVPVTVTATAADGATETLVITRIVPAQIDIVMSVGQSNAYGKGGTASEAPRVRPGTAYDILYDGDTQAANKTAKPMPLANTEGTGTAVAGVRQAFANEWYATVGEKILFINAADPGIKIAEWLPTGKVYKGAKTEYDRVKALLEKNENFEVYREFFYFNHGSADAGGNFNASYYQNVNTVFDTLFQETDMEFGTVFEYFSSDRDYTTWIRANHNRIIAENPKIYMGCEMKPYIQADPSLLKDDNLHLTQKGHNLCGTIMAQNTVSQALVLPGKSGSGVPVRLDEPTYAYDFDKSLKASRGGNDLQVLTTAPAYTADGTAAVFNGAASLKFANKIKLRSDSDFCIEFRMKLTGSAKQFAVLGSPDNCAQVYINLSDGKTKGFKVRYGAEGVQGTALTLSVRDINDFYEYNVWRLYYVSDLSLLYLYRDNELQSTEILPGLMTLSQIGKTGTVSQSGCTAELDYLKIWTEDAGGNYHFDFEKTLKEDNAAVELTESKTGSYQSEAVLLKYSSNDYSFDQITFDRSKDWSLEVRGQVSKGMGVVAAADGSNTIYANVSDPGFRVRTDSSSYIKLLVSSGDFSEMHTWRLDYSAAAHTVTLYRDGEKLSSGTLNTTLKFTHSGASGSSGGSNAALLDYIHMKQEGINKNGTDTVNFDFDHSLTDASGGYTMKLEKGSTEYSFGDTGYVLEKGSELTFSQGIPLPKSEFALSIKGQFDGTGTVMPDVLSIGENGFVFAGQEFPVENRQLLSAVNEWKFVCKDGKAALTYPDGKLSEEKAVKDTMTLGKIGGIGMTLYSLDIQAQKAAKTAPLTVEIHENQGVSLAVASTVYDLSGAEPNVIWYKNGHAIPAGDFSRTGYRAGDVISCRISYQGIPCTAEADCTVKADYPYPLSGTEELPAVVTEGNTTPEAGTEPGEGTEPADGTGADDTGAAPKSGCGSLAAFPFAVIAAVCILPFFKKEQ